MKYFPLKSGGKDLIEKIKQDKNIKENHQKAINETEDHAWSIYTSFLKNDSIKFPFPFYNTWSSFSTILKVWQQVMI